MDNHFSALLQGLDMASHTEAVTLVIGLLAGLFFRKRKRVDSTTLNKELPNESVTPARGSTQTEESV